MDSPIFLLFLFSLFYYILFVLQEKLGAYRQGEVMHSTFADLLYANVYLPTSLNPLVFNLPISSFLTLTPYPLLRTTTSAH